MASGAVRCSQARYRKSHRKLRVWHRQYRIKKLGRVRKRWMTLEGVHENRRDEIIWGINKNRKEAAIELVAPEIGCTPLPRGHGGWCGEREIRDSSPAKASIKQESHEEPRESMTARKAKPSRAQIGGRKRRRSQADRRECPDRGELVARTGNRGSRKGRDNKDQEKRVVHLQETLKMEIGIVARSSSTRREGRRT
jgi:hypothetical protein